MKKELTLVLETNDRVYTTLQEIKSHGYNATVVSTESLRHAVDYVPNDQHFISLRHIEQVQQFESILCLFVVEETKLENLKQLIRNQTNDFKDIKGFMYSRDIEDYEGSI